MFLNILGIVRLSYLRGCIVYMSSMPFSLNRGSIRQCLSLPTLRRIVAKTGHWSGATVDAISMGCFQSTCGKQCAYCLTPCKQVSLHFFSSSTLSASLENKWILVHPPDSVTRIASSVGRSFSLDDCADVKHSVRFEHS